MNVTVLESGTTLYAEAEHADAILKALIAAAVSLTKVQFPPLDFPKFEFGAPYWDMNPEGVAWQTCPAYASFFDAEGVRGRAARERAPILPVSFADVIKAWVIHRGLAPGSINNNVQSASALWRILAPKMCKGGRPFRWDDLRPSHLRMAAAQIEKTHPKSAYLRQSHWKHLVSWLELNEVLPDGFDWSPSSHKADLRPEAQLERAKKVPKRAILEALAYIYRHATERMDRLLICTIGLLVTCGFRASEVLSLPMDCLVSEKIRGKTKWGIRYWRRKTKDGAYKHAIRWLSPLGAELAKACVKEILEITADARAQARRLEADKSRVRIPWFGRRKLLTRTEAAAALGVVPGSIAPLIREGYLKLTPVVKGYHDWWFRREEIESELLRRRPPLRTLQISARKFQSLSETLLMTFVYETDPQAMTSPLLVRTLPMSTLSIFIGGYQGDQQSAFERFGLDPRENGNDDKSRMRLHTHMLRHWLNTVANKAGMSAFQITLWMGRGSVLETMMYLHPSADIADFIRENLRSDRLVGKRPEEYSVLPQAKRAAYESLIRNGSQVSNGYCCNVRDCQMHKNCDTACSSFVAVKGDRGALPELWRRREGFLAALELYDRSAAAGVRLVPRQRKNAQDALKRIDKLISVAESPQEEYAAQ